MNKYLVSVISSKSGSHEVHLAQCNNLPKYVNEVGEYEDFQQAIEAISRILPQVHPCSYCISPNKRKIPIK